MSKYLAEIIPAQILAHLQTNMDAALAAETAAFPDGIVPLVQPEAYFDYEEANPPQCPALYVIEDRIDYRLDRGPNFISALAVFRCGIIVEDFRAKELTHAARRYANVLHGLLHGTKLDYTVSGSVKVRDILRVASTSFSDTFRKNAEGSAESNPYRKEFVHEVEIEHYENFS
jgi:hypothetical protein